MKKRNHIFIYGLVSFIVLLLSATLIYRAYSFYEENNFFDLIHGEVPNQNFDIFVSYYEDNNGEETLLSSMPEGREYQVEIVCNQGGSGYWNYEEWTAVIQAQKPRTKCSIHFSPKQPTFIATIRSISSTNSGDGLYEITHPDTEFTDSFSGNLTSMQISNLKLKELRYAGKSPNNYVKFNEELWRVIGLVNTPEGKRVKLVRNESIGNYSWDSSDSSINGGSGINEWSTSSLQEYLNLEYYANLSDVSKLMVEELLWNQGSNDLTIQNKANPIQFYDLERSNQTGIGCNDDSNCNDTVLRKTTWLGRIGLMYPSDYGFATIGGSNTNYSTCMTLSLFSWNQYEDCYTNNWIHRKHNQWLMTAYQSIDGAGAVFYLHGEGSVFVNGAFRPNQIYPTFYLKNQVKVMSGDGSFDFPYELVL